MAKKLSACPNSRTQALSGKLDEPKNREAQNAEEHFVLDSGDNMVHTMGQSYQQVTRNLPA